VVRLHVVDDVGVPLLGLGAVEVTADDGAAAPLQQGQGVGADGAGRDVGVVDDRPDLLATSLGRLDVGDLGLEVGLDSQGRCG